MDIKLDILDRRSNGVWEGMMVFIVLMLVLLVEEEVVAKAVVEAIVFGSGKIIRYSRSTINAYSLLSHAWWVSP